ncbi:hypothetical protein Rhal01_02701 [Rubritalea halochordaticola]|uniref:GYF domain-containing protein n=1 Tax=Rubritalea halochordaticola TaxID=714537 RepID=A0ABP9V587_9BACT
MSNWYYSKDNQQHGPIGAEELKAKLGSELPADTLVWREGMANWSPARSVTELNFTPQQPMPQPTPQAASPMAGAATAEGALNPYAAPTSNALDMQMVDYPLPFVKRANYGLLLGSWIGGVVLLLIGIVMMGVMSAESYGPPADDVSIPAVLLMLLGAGIFCFGAILGLVYVHRAWTVLQPAGASTTPGKAVGFLFIPLFNIYWTFVAYWKWAKEWNEAKPRYQSLQHAPQGSEGVFLGASICQCVGLVIGGVGFIQFILQLIGMKSMCEVINFAHENSAEKGRF